MRTTKPTKLASLSCVAYFKEALISASTLVLATLAFSAAPALAETETLQPWWHLRTSTRPSNIQPGTATDDVQQVTVEPDVENNEYELTASAGGLIGRYFREKPSTSGGWHVKLARTASATEVEAALEGEYIYGPGDVEVTNWQETNGVVSYDVRFIGKLADLPVQPIQVPAGEEQSVRVKQLVLGRPDGEIVVTATNVGDAGAPVECVNVGAGHGQYPTASCSGTREEPGAGEFEQRLKQPVSISDALPPGLEAVAIAGDVGQQAPSLNAAKTPPLACSLATLSCEFDGEHPSADEDNPLEFNSYPNSFPPFETIQMFVAVNVTDAAAVTTKENEAHITGAGAPAARTSRPLTVSGAPIPFGLDTYEMTPEEPGGTADTQAGSHPFQLTTTEETNITTEAAPVGLAKDLHFDLPPGLIGDPSAIPRCTLQQFYTLPPGLAEAETNTECPADTMVGVNVVRVRTDAGESFQTTVHSPVFNLEPAPGEPARFGFEARGTHVLLTTAVRTGGDYGVTVNATNISETIEFISAELTFWGVPDAAAHNPAREAVGGSNGPVAQANPPAFLSLPTSCNGKPLESTVAADSWEEPANVLAPFFTTEPMVTLAGCNHLPFQPSIVVKPDSEQASKPTGLDVDVHVNQDSVLNPEGLAESQVGNIEVTLPQGVILNPSAADGLEACSANTADHPTGGELGTPGDQIGFGVEEAGRLAEFTEFKSQPGVSTPRFTPYLPGSNGALAAVASGQSPEREATLTPGVNFCPNASKIAEVTIHTPLLPKNQPLTGFVYLAAPQNYSTLSGFPQENPFGKHVAMYIVAEDPVSGSLVKLPGKVELGGEPGVEGLAPGQIRSTVADPQLPFEDAELHFFGGERAPLASPTHCGSYTTEATFTPWSGGEPVSSSYTFPITSGPNGSPCPGAALPFNASLESGTTSNNAGGFSALSTTLSRPDGNQNIQSVTLHYPAGLSGLLSGVELCGEPQANNGTCGPNSQIGETIVSVGVGGDPFTVTGGKAYITGPYNGTGSCSTPGSNGCAPFGLSIVNPAKAGPFNLQEGRPVIVRAKIEVNPTTAALTITTNESGAHAIPTIIEGFPLQIQHVNVLVNRNNFTFNPTNCTPAKVTGTIESSGEPGSGAGKTSAAVEVPFQATNCQALKFAPHFAFSTSGKTSKADGASLHVSLTYPAPFNYYANIGRVKVELPKALPSRLTTLQKACTDAQFEANPAGCPSASFIGHAKAITPLLPVPLEGPAIFVSHGGEAFPSLEFVLQGYGVKIILVGTTFISKSGITSTTFKQVPDQPVTSFELTLPEGPFSALAANGNLCNQKLVMPNESIAQNGAAVYTNTPVTVEGCKPAITVVKHSVKGHTATLVVSVPSAGKLVASAKGLSKGSGKSGAAGTITVKLHLTGAEQSRLAKHRGRRLAAKVHLTFTPKKGSRLTTSTTVLVG
jgi:hypothetical protein